MPGPAQEYRVEMRATGAEQAAAAFRTVDAAAQQSAANQRQAAQEVAAEIARINAARQQELRLAALRAAAAGDDQTAAALREELALRQRAEQLQRAMNLAEHEAIALAQEELVLTRQIAAAEAQQRAAAEATARAEREATAAARQRAAAEQQAAAAAQNSFGGQLSGALAARAGIAGGLAAAGANAVVGGLSSVIAEFTDAVTGGVRFNETMADSEVAIANVIQRFSGLNAEAAKNEAAKAMEAIQEEEPKTAATLEGLVQGFLATQAAAASAGITTEQNVKLVGALANALANANIPAEQLTQELRSIVTGNITADSALARTLGLTNQMVATAKANGTLYDFLITQIGSLGTAGDTNAVKISSLDSALQKLGGRLTKPIYDGKRSGIELLTQVVGLANIALDVFGGEAQEAARQNRALEGSATATTAELDKEVKAIEEMAAVMVKVRAAIDEMADVNTANRIAKVNLAEAQGTISAEEAQVARARARSAGENTKLTNQEQAAAEPLRITEAKAAAAQQNANEARARTSAALERANAAAERAAANGVPVGQLKPGDKSALELLKESETPREKALKAELENPSGRLRPREDVEADLEVAKLPRQRAIEAFESVIRLREREKVATEKQREAEAAHYEQLKETERVQRRISKQRETLGLQEATEITEAGNATTKKQEEAQKQAQEKREKTVKEATEAIRDLPPEIKRAPVAQPTAAPTTTPEPSGATDTQDTAARLLADRAVDATKTNKARADVERAAAALADGATAEELANLAAALEKVDKALSTKNTREAQERQQLAARIRSLEATVSRLESGD